VGKATIAVTSAMIGAYWTSTLQVSSVAFPTLLMLVGGWLIGGVFTAVSTLLIFLINHTRDSLRVFSFPTFVSVAFLNLEFVNTCRYFHLIAAALFWLPSFLPSLPPSFLSYLKVLDMGIDTLLLCFCEAHHQTTNPMLPSSLHQFKDSNNDTLHEGMHKSRLRKTMRIIPWSIQTSPPAR
jgi:hypothetical protein